MLFQLFEYHFHMEDHQLKKSAHHFQDVESILFPKGNLEHHYKMLNLSETRYDLIYGTYQQTFTNLIRSTYTRERKVGAGTRGQI